MSALAFAVGAAAGFAGAIPPGPAAMAVAAHATEGRARSAVRVGLGAALVDAVVCCAIALGAGPTLARLTEPPAVRVFLAVAYAAVGLLVVGESLVCARKRPAAAPPPARADGLFRGFVRGVTNPSLIANWTMLITGLGAAHVLPRGSIAGIAFAVGVGVGVSAWFAVLTHIVGRARAERVSPWLRGVGAATGAVLVVAGSVGALRVLTG